MIVMEGIVLMFIKEDICVKVVNKIYYEDYNFLDVIWKGEV